MTFGVLPWPLGLYTLMLHFFSMIDIQERELNFFDFKRIIMFMTGLRLDVYEMISFRFGVIIHMTKFW